tara:strand:+ start:333 stop:635 length:303 start_codon:yes stop_codon:yes gene_type:complete
MNINFQSVNFKIDQKLIHFAEKKISKLELCYFNIINIDVTFKLENNSDRVSKFVEFNIKIPGEDVIVKKTSKSFEESIDLNVKSAERILIKNKEILNKLF